jgi:CHAT domain-containing protein
VFQYLSAERDLLRHRDRTKTKGGSLVMGAPDFDAALDAIAQAAIPAPGGPEGGAAPASVPLYRGPTSACANFATLRFDPLPATIEEASEVESAWRRAAPPGAATRPGSGGAETTRLTGSLATEEAFKTIAPQRGHLHLATHGFYLGPACGPPRAAETLPGAAGADATVLDENPLLLSGIALAGANHRASTPRDAEDGILTAEEIASLDLSGVEWAVLSGCETALGSIQAGEGIFGLRRAFEVAGADTLIMSLWKVEDRATLEWMKTLYERHAAGVPVADAVRDAGVAILRARRDKGWSTHPFYWGAFVSAGGWR